MTTEEEIWKDIEGYEGLYQVSSFGRVKSLDRYVRHASGSFESKRLQKGKTCKLILKDTGYYQVSLCKKGTKYSALVHRLVAEAFIPKIINKHHINHKNGIKTDNSLCNIEWCDQTDNNRHAFKTGLNKPRYGAENHSSIPVVQVNKKTDAYIRRYASAKEAQRITGIWATNIATVCKGKVKTAGGFKWMYADE